MTEPRDSGKPEHDDFCERIDVDIGVGTMTSPCGCHERALIARAELAESRLIAAQAACKEALAAVNENDSVLARWQEAIESAKARAERAEAELARLRAFILALDAHKCGEEYSAVNDMQRQLEAKNG